MRECLGPEAQMRFFLPVVLMAFAAASHAEPVLMISIDGLRPDDITDAKARGLKIPTLSSFIDKGAYATGVKPVLPSVTYPNHTTLVTGVAPRLHCISNNYPLDPSGQNLLGWYWYASDIKVPTLWEQVHANHKVVANMSWPVTVGMEAIDYNIPNYWRAGTPDDIKLLRALSTPKLMALLEKETGASAGAISTNSDAPESDIVACQFAAKLIELKKPEFMTLYLSSLDAVEHKFGPDTLDAKTALETIDKALGTLLVAVRKVAPTTTIVIVSDHGFATTTHDVSLMKAFVESGLVTFDPVAKKLKSWKALPWPAGGSAAIVLENPNDEETKNKVTAILTKLAANPENGIAKVIDKAEIEARGGPKEASLFVDFAIGYEMVSANFIGDLVTPATMKGMHGYFPEHKEMRSTFMIQGPAVKKKGSLGEIDMVDIAPTLAKLLGVVLPHATGKSLF